MRRIWGRQGSTGNRRFLDIADGLDALVGPGILAGQRGRLAAGMPRRPIWLRHGKAS